MKTTGSLVLGFFKCLLAIAAVCSATAAISETNDDYIKALWGADYKSVELALKKGRSALTTIALASAPESPTSPMHWLMHGTNPDLDAESYDTNKVKVARLLMSRGATVEPRDSLMYVAVASGHVNTMKLLLEARQEVNRRIEGYLPTELAIKSGQAKLYAVLLAMGGEPVAGQVEKQLKLMLAVSKHDRKGVETAIQHGADINARDPSGSTALGSFLATPILMSDREYMKYRLDFLAALLATWNANPGISSGSVDHSFPIIQWVESNSYGKDEFDLSAVVIESLVKFGVDVNVVDYLDQTALHKAAKRGNLPAAKALVGAGANHRKKDRSGRIALDLAGDPTMRAFLRSLP